LSADTAKLRWKAWPHPFVISPPERQELMKLANSRRAL